MAFIIFLKRGFSGYIFLYFYIFICVYVFFNITIYMNFINFIKSYYCSQLILLLHHYNIGELWKYKMLII